MARKKRDLPEINAGSMADIAFLLLIFFLVTTTMDTDTGIFRKLPPIIETPDEAPPVNKRNVMNLVLNQNNDLLAKEEPLALNALKDKMIEFLTSKKENMAEDPKKALVSIKTHRLSDYKSYVTIQDQLQGAYLHVRNLKANEMFSKDFEKLNDDDKKEIKKLIPMSISEVEPIKD
jgi:biopolymer transport protein ExbD